MAALRLLGRADRAPVAAAGPKRPPVEKSDRAAGLRPRLAPARLTELGDDDKAWMALAECSGEETAMFFPEQGGSKAQWLAKRFCEGCVVSSNCDQYAEQTGNDIGVWGGVLRGTDIWKQQRKAAQQ